MDSLELFLLGKLLGAKSWALSGGVGETSMMAHRVMTHWPLRFSSSAL